MAAIAVACAAVVVTVVGACSSPLPEHGASRAGPAGSDARSRSAPSFVFDPAPGVDGASPISRITIDPGGVAADGRAILVRGELTESQLRDVARSVLPATLTARAASVLAWVDDGSGLIAVAPLDPLAFGALYTIGLGSPPLALPFQVAPSYPDIPLARIWPPRALARPPALAAVWCASNHDPLFELESALALAASFAPGAVAGHFRTGTGCSIVASQCLGWFADTSGEQLLAAASSVAGAVLPVVAPPLVTYGDELRIALDPLIMFPDAVGQSVDPIACTESEISFGPGCASVDDDRIIVRPPDGALLWTVEGGAGVDVRASDQGRRWVLRPLPVGGHYRLATLDTSGARTESDVSVTPAAAHSHVVLNEVMANPAGAEPAQEWIELYNDGSSEQSLDGYALDDGSSRTALPPAQLAPGKFALLVTDAYIADDGVDPVPAPATTLLRMRSLGQGGLSNEGERLILRDATGAVVSTFAPLKTKNGVAAARVVPDSFDDDPLSFAPSANGSATPGAPNDR